MCRILMLKRFKIKNFRPAWLWSENSISRHRELGYSSVVALPKHVRPWVHPQYHKTKITVGREGEEEGE